MKLVYGPPPLLYAKAANGSDSHRMTDQGMQKRIPSVPGMAIIAKPNFLAVNF